MKILLIGGAAAIALAAGTAALAQTGAAPAPAPMADKIVTRAEVLAMVRDRFAKLDANKDGAVTTDELANIRERVKARVMTMRGDGKDSMAEQPGAIFDRIDENRDGMISRDEFAKHRQVRIEKRVVIRDGKAADKGGMRMHGMHGGMGGGGPMMILRMADANKDGRITSAEAESAALKHFEMADINRDGRITPDERRQMHERMGAEHGHDHG